MHQRVRDSICLLFYTRGREREREKEKNPALQKGVYCSFFSSLYQLKHHLKKMSWTCLGLSSFGFPMALKVGIFTALLLLTGGVTSQGQMPPTTPTAGMVCISDCPTCPVICSSPPPLSVPSYQPPLPPLPTLPPPPPPHAHHHHPPPETYRYSSPPPPSLEPLPPAPPAPALPTQLPPPEAPSLYPSWGAPPPPFKYSNNAPFGLGTPGMGMGGHDYSYPYYYFHASEAASLAGHCYLFMLLLLFPCCMIVGYG